MTCPRRKRLLNKKVTLVINNIKVKHADELMQYLEMLKKNEGN